MATIQIPKDGFDAIPQAIFSRFRFVEEQEKDRQEKLVVRRADDGIAIHAIAIDREPAVQREFFEKGWGAYLVKEG